MGILRAHAAPHRLPSAAHGPRRQPAVPARGRPDAGGSRTSRPGAAEGADRDEHDALERQHHRRRREAGGPFHRRRASPRPTSWSCAAPAGGGEAGDLVVRYRGTGTRKPMLFFAHLDVVEARREDWTVDPFLLTERDGYFYGRGTSTSKAGPRRSSPSSCACSARASCPTATSSRADGGRRGRRRQRRGLAPGQPARPHGRRLRAEHDAGRRRNARREARHAGRAGSGESVRVFRVDGDEPGRAQLDAAEGQRHLPAGRRPAAAGRLRVPRPAHRGDPRLFRKMAPLSGRTAPTCRAVAEPRPTRRRRRGCRANLPSTTRCCAPPASPRCCGRARRERAPQTARATVNCRIIPGEAADAVQAALVRVVGDAHLEVAPIKPAKPSPPSALAAEPLSAIESAARAAWGSSPAVPIAAVHGHGRHRRPLPAHGRHPRLRHHRHRLRSRRLSRARQGRAHPGEVVQRGTECSPTRWPRRSARRTDGRAPGFFSLPSNIARLHPPARRRPCLTVGRVAQHEAIEANSVVSLGFPQSSAAKIDAPWLEPAHASGAAARPTVDNAMYSRGFPIARGWPSRCTRGVARIRRTGAAFRVTRHHPCVRRLPRIGSPPRGTSHPHTPGGLAGRSPRCS